MKSIKRFICILSALSFVFSLFGCSGEKQKSRFEMTPDERLAAALDDLFKGGNYDISVDIKYDIIDGNQTTNINTEIIKNTDENGTIGYVKRLNGEYNDEYYIDNAYYKPDGTLSHPDFPLVLEKETLVRDITPEMMGEYIYVDGENFKTYEFTVPKDKLKDLIIPSIKMTANEAKGSVVLDLNGYLMGYKIKAKTERWISENMYYEYDFTLTVTVNAINEKTEKIVLPFEYNSNS